jgi:uncharacterized membrane protein
VPPGVTLYDWLLALHVLAGFVLVAAYVLFAFLIAWSWRRDTPGATLRLSGIGRVGNVLVAIGAVATLVLGIWLAIDSDQYEVWDGWVIAALVLWAISMETGRRSGAHYAKASARAAERAGAGADVSDPELGAILRDRGALVLQVVSAVAVLLLIVDMIYKPGA